MATTSSGRESTERQTAVSLSVGNEEKIDHQKVRVGTKICVKIFLVEKINKNRTNIGFVQFQALDHLLLGE